MDISIIHGQNHKGSTYNVTSLIQNQLSNSTTQVREYFLPKDAPGFCVGCFNCITKGEQYCAHHEKVQAIVDSMCASKIIIIDSPTYCFEMSGQLKTLFDHMGYMWMSHRPKKEMFNKVGIVVSTAAGGGAKSVTKSIRRQLTFMGVPKVYRVNVNVSAMCYEDVPDKIKKKIKDKTNRVSKRVNKSVSKFNRNLFITFFFSIMRKMNQSNTWNMTDKNYWQENDWLEKDRPW